MGVLIVTCFMQIENAAFSLLEVTVDIAYDYDELFVPQVGQCCCLYHTAACRTLLFLPRLGSLDNCVKWNGGWV